MALVGCTASGKSALALDLARTLGGVELVSVDSMQVYRGMDIGTAKPSPAEQAEIRHHLIDVADPHEEYTVARFCRDYDRVIEDITTRGAHPLLVGGTGLYLRAVLDDLDLPGRFPEVRALLEHEADTQALHRRLSELDPVAAGRMEPTNRRRIVRALEVTLGSGRAFSSYGPGLDTYPDRGHVMVGVRLPRPVIDARIADRYDTQMAGGFLAEVESLARRSDAMSVSARQALGYKELLAHVEQGIDLDECLESARTRTRRFARRQERWFRRDPRVRWFDADDNPFAVRDRLLREYSQFLADQGDRL